jgi:hypothetical protein
MHKRFVENADANAATASAPKDMKAPMAIEEA